MIFKPRKDPAIRPPKERGLVEFVLLKLAECIFTVFLAVTVSTTNVLFARKALAAVGVSKTISYQGRLTDTNGNPLGGAGTDYCFRFSIYNAPTGGGKLWPNGTPQTNTVNVANGIFSVGIGDVDDLSTFNFYSSDTTYLNIEVADQVGGSCVGASFESLTPRQRIDATAYSRVARDVYGDLLRTDNGNNRVQIGTGAGSATPVFLGLDVRNTPESAGDSCSVQGTVWYNSTQSKAFICTGNPAKLQEFSNEGVLAGVKEQSAASAISTGTVIFSASNNLTISQNDQTLLFSVPTPVQAFGVSDTAGNTTGNGSVMFVAGGNITLNQATAPGGQTITIAGATAGGTGGGIGALSASGNFVSNGTVVFSNSNNISFGMSGSTITAIAAGASNVINGIGAGSQTGTSGTVVFSNANNISFGMDNNSVITGSIPAIPTAYIASLNGSTGQVSISGGNNVTVSNNNSTIFISAAAASAGVGGIAAGNNTYTSGTVVFSNANNVSFGTNGQTITASGGLVGTNNGTGGTGLTAGSAGTVLLIAD